MYKVVQTSFSYYVILNKWNFTISCNIKGPVTTDHTAKPHETWRHVNFGVAEVMTLQSSTSFHLQQMNTLSCNPYINMCIVNLQTKQVIFARSNAGRPYICSARAKGERGEFRTLNSRWVKSVFVPQGVNLVSYKATKHWEKHYLKLDLNPDFVLSIFPR